MIFYQLTRKHDQKHPYPPPCISSSTVCWRYLNSKFIKLHLILLMIMGFSSSLLKAQDITLKVKQAAFKSVLDKIERQSGYDFWYNKTTLNENEKISIEVKGKPLNEVLKQILDPKQLNFEIVDRTIFIRPVLRSPPYNPSSPQDDEIHGSVRDENGNPVPNATLSIKGTDRTFVANEYGNFNLQRPKVDGSILISSLGFITSEIPFGRDKTTILSVILKENTASLEDVEVISTGYQKVPRNRATGSFVLIDSALFNRKVSTNILDRLDGVTSGLRLNTRTTLSNQIITGNPLNRTLGISIRGQSTLSTDVGSDPLIILDNFPYDGDLRNLNPNDVESISVLKDAAAASIWGARSGNGVIVITTKKGRKNTAPSIEFNANLSIQDRPNLYYDRNFVSAADYIGVEKYLFNQGYFNSSINDASGMSPVSPVITLLAAQRAGKLSAQELENRLTTLGAIDVRDDYSKYSYQQATLQQYSLGLRGGNANATYSLGIGYDDNTAALRKNGYNRLTINSQNVYTPIKGLDLSIALIYSNNKTSLNNELVYGGLNVGGSNSRYTTIFPYAQFADPNGNALSTVRDYSAEYIAGATSKGFLNWMYRPLEEIDQSDQYTKINSLTSNFGANYKITPFLALLAQYQNEHQNIRTWNNRNIQSYYTRNLINMFTLINSGGVNTYQLPKGGILNAGAYELNANNARLQLNLDKAIGSRHQLTALLGAEIRETRTQGSSTIAYGYDDEFGTVSNALNYTSFVPVNPTGFAIIASPTGNVTGSLNRYVSYFSNASYAYDNRYVLTLSGRKDGANIFGARTNDKVTPLWSSGLGWNISNEHFYQLSWLTLLKLRATYGFNGNVYNGSAYVKGTYSSNSLNNAVSISGLTGPNPNLRWEKVENLNLGLDFSVKKGLFNGSIEAYQKRGTDLIEPITPAPSSGFNSLIVNAAATRTRGIDLTLNTDVARGELKWRNTLLLSTLNDKITKYDIRQSVSTVQNAGLGMSGIVDYPIYSLFSYKWAGLDPLNGDPQGYLNGKISKDYSAILNNFSPDSLVYHGSSRPTWFGSFRNDLEFRGLSLSINITYAAGFKFRRPSTTLNYQEVLTGYANADYGQRWQKAGDELVTAIPSLLYPSDSRRNTFYQHSAILIERGDHIRLSDIRLAYDLKQRLLKKSRFTNIQLYTYASNLGIIWRANRFGIDPDLYSFSTLSHSLPNPFTIAFGLKANF